MRSGVKRLVFHAQRGYSFQTFMFGAAVAIFFFVIGIWFAAVGKE